MKKALFLVLCVLVLAAGMSYAEDINKDAAKPALRQVDVDRDDDGTMDGVDEYNDDGKVVRRGWDKNGDGVMDSWRTYDPNTGLPNMVESDRGVELP